MSKYPELIKVGKSGNTGEGKEKAKFPYKKKKKTPKNEWQVEKV